MLCFSQGVGGFFVRFAEKFIKKLLSKVDLTFKKTNIVLFAVTLHPKSIMYH